MIGYQAQLVGTQCIVGNKQEIILASREKQKNFLKPLAVHELVILDLC